MTRLIVLVALALAFAPSSSALQFSLESGQEECIEESLSDAQLRPARCAGAALRRGSRALRSLRSPPSAPSAACRILPNSALSLFGAPFNALIVFVSRPPPSSLQKERNSHNDGLKRRLRIPTEVAQPVLFCSQPIHSQRGVPRPWCTS